MALPGPNLEGPNLTTMECKLATGSTGDRRPSSPNLTTMECKPGNVHARRGKGSGPNLTTMECKLYPYAEGCKPD